MIKNKLPLLLAAILFGSSTAMLSCSKENAPQEEQIASPVFPVEQNRSFVEQFDTVSKLTTRGWVFKNNSAPLGQSGWRQGRYESANIIQYKNLGSIQYVGFPAYNSSYTPNDFISCDVSAVQDDYTNGGTLSAWLISPSLPMKNNDQIIFYTRATADFMYPVYTKDRMQVWLNPTDGSANVGNAPGSTGSFTNKLLDINQNYIFNDPTSSTGPGGYPQAWTKYTITLSGLPAAGITNGRFAFRYYGEDAGISGGSTANNYPTVVGIDSLAFIHQQ
jgi:hypothetical protein